MPDTAEIDKVARQVIDARRRVKRANREKETADREKARLEQQLFDMLAEAGFKPGLGGLSRDLGEGYGVFRINPRSTKFGQILDADAAEQALIERGLDTEGIFRKEVRKQQVNQIVREDLDNGRPLPEGIGWYEKQGITFTAKK